MTVATLQDAIVVEVVPVTLHPEVSFVLVVVQLVELVSNEVHDTKALVTVLGVKVVAVGCGSD